MKILAVDDDEIILELLQGTLAVAGFEDVTTCLSADQALSAIDQSAVPFDCLLFDIQMPHKNGIDLCKQVRSMPTYRSSPIIMITAMADKDYIDAAFQAGATDYVTKPFDVTELGTRIKIAANLVRQQKAAQNATHALASLQNAKDWTAKVDIATPFGLTDVDKTLDSGAFENYLKLLNRKEYLTSGLFAMRVTNVAEIYDKCDSDEFRDSMSDVAEALGNVLYVDFDFLSYRGDGLFVVAFARALRPDIGNLKIALQAELDDFCMVYKNGRKMPVNFVFGDPVYPGVFANSGLHRLLTQAIENSWSVTDGQDSPAPARFGEKPSLANRLLSGSGFLRPTDRIASR